jgi:rod shape-determining protein MreC
VRELIDFFIRNSKWFVFTFFVVISLMMLFNHNPYQQHVYMTSAGKVASSVYKVSNNITSYFNLRENNEDLNRRIADLQCEVLGLREQLQKMQEEYGYDSLTLAPVLRHYDFIVARVINNSVMRPYNYITLNKGSEDGIAPEMGVLDQNGVVGVVNVVGPHASRVISLLNPNFRLSCKIKGNESFGSLVWDGQDPQYALLEELPRHTVFQRGDTVITSGYSAVFPEGIPVGIVEQGDEKHNENFFTLKVRLLSDFSRLNNVQVVINHDAEEIRAIETDNVSNDKSK